MLGMVWCVVYCAVPTRFLKCNYAAIKHRACCKFHTTSNTDKSIGSSTIVPERSAEGASEKLDVFEIHLVKKLAKMYPPKIGFNLKEAKEFCPENVHFWTEEHFLSCLMKEAKARSKKLWHFFEIKRIRNTSWMLKIAVFRRTNPKENVTRRKCWRFEQIKFDEFWKQIHQNASGMPLILLLNPGKCMPKIEKG